MKQKEIKLSHVYVDNRTKKQKLRHENNYLYWKKDATKKRVSHDEWNALRDVLNDDKKVQGLGTKTVNYYWFNESWNIDDAADKSSVHMYLKHDNGLYIFYTPIDPNKNSSIKVNGYEAYSEVDKVFSEAHGVSLRQAFGALPKGETVERQCCRSCTNVIWRNKSYDGRILKSGYKADLSSAFPHNSRGILPDARSRLIIKGVAEPSVEFPFAFYDNGDVCILNEVDTRKLHNHTILKDPNSKGKLRWTTDEIKETVLMKKATYQLDKTMLELYNKKETTNEDQKRYYKDVLVSFFGFLYSTNPNTTNRNYYAPHVAAAMLARYIKQITSIFDSLVAEYNEPVQLLTDSVIWIGAQSDTATDKKELGAFVYEAKNYKMVSLGAGRYAMESLIDGDFFCKHQGLAIEEDLKKADVKTVNGFIKFMLQVDVNKKVIDRYNPKTQKFEQIEHFEE